MTAVDEKPGPSMRKFRRGMSKVFRPASKGKDELQLEEVPAAPAKVDEVKEVRLLLFKKKLW